MHLLSGDQPFLDQQFAHRRFHDLVIGHCVILILAVRMMVIRIIGMKVVMVMVMVIAMIVGIGRAAHAAFSRSVGSSQNS